MQIEIRRGRDRAVSTYDGVVSRHSFSFGAHYDPDNVSFGALVSHNEDSLQPHHGYAAHPHAELEIVTWVLEGSLQHESSLADLDGAPDQAELIPGDVQVLGAGSGLTHSEIAGPRPTRFVQMWVTPDTPGLEPRVARERLTADTDGQWTYVPGIRNSRASVGLARLSQATSVALPDAPQTHVYVCSGMVSLDTGQTLVAGDTLRASQCGGLALTGVGHILAVSTGPQG